MGKQTLTGCTGTSVVTGKKGCCEKKVIKLSWKVRDCVIINNILKPAMWDFYI